MKGTEKNNTCRFNSSESEKIKEQCEGVGWGGEECKLGSVIVSWGGGGYFMHEQGQRCVF